MIACDVRTLTSFRRQPVPLRGAGCLRLTKSPRGIARASSCGNQVLVAHLLQLEHVLHGVVEVLGDQKRQAQGGDVVALFHGADGLAADANNLRQGFLGDALFLPKGLQAVVDSVGCHIQLMTQRIPDSVKRVKRG